MTMSDELAPLRRDLVDRARADAERTLADARAEAARRIAEAQRTAADILDSARKAGASDAAATVAGSRRQVRADARDAELAAQRAVYVDLLARVTVSVGARLATPDARAALRRLVGDSLGDNAVVTELPGGGALGTVAGHRLEMSARRLAEQGLEHCPGRVRAVDVVTGGRVGRVSGPLVEVDGLPDVAMFDLVALGSAGLPGEVTAVRDGVASVQAYEYTGGLRPGEPVVGRGRPLSARLGPGLLGAVFDGLLRPLSGAPTWLAPGAMPAPAVRRWQFEPTVRIGDQVEPGAGVGIVNPAAALPHHVLVPPGVRGVVEMVQSAGSRRDDEPVARVSGVDITLTSHWPVRTPRPCRRRSQDVEPLRTGQRAVNLLFPIAKGGSAAVPGGFGTGKTMLLQQIAKWCDADVIVYVGCGERGNEMAEVVADLFELADPRTGGRLADRTVVIANTSNMPMMARQASVHTGVTVAEYFRDMGYHVVVIADSTSRWAEALREFASRTGALPAEEGYPADLASALASFYERAGAVVTLGGLAASVTVVGAVSPPSGDMTEPVTTYTERFTRCRWTLDRDLAYARHYPAISWSSSFARDAVAIGAKRVAAGQTGWAARRARLADTLAEADQLAGLAELVGVAALPDRERVAMLAGRLIREAVLQQNSLSPVDAYCSDERADALVQSTVDVIDRCRAAGAAADVLERLDFGPLPRAREEAAQVLARRDEVLARIGELS
jgi:V/A-type H+-transporting ATPase subunit A